jgi:hypothetical protein
LVFLEYNKKVEEIKRKVIMKSTLKRIALASAASLALPLISLAQVTIPNPGLPGTAFGAGDATIGATITAIVGIALAIAGLIAILFLIIGGFRYVTAGGNEEAAESAKKIILNAIIGIIVIILSYVILQVVANAIQGNTGA